MLLNSGPLNTAVLNGSAAVPAAEFGATASTFAVAQATLGDLQKTLAATRQVATSTNAAFGFLQPLASDVRASAAGIQAGLAAGKTARAAVAASATVTQVSLGDLQKTLACSRQVSAAVSAVLSYLKVLEADAMSASAVSSTAVVRTDLKELQSNFVVGRARVLDAQFGDLQKTLAASGVAAASAFLGPFLNASAVAGAAAFVEFGDLQKTLQATRTARATVLTAFFGIAELGTRDPSHGAPRIRATAAIQSAYISGGTILARAQVSANAVVDDAGLMLIRLRSYRYATATATAELGGIPQRLDAQVTARAVVSSASPVVNLKELAAFSSVVAQATAQLRAEKPLEVQSAAAASVVDAGLMQVRLGATALASAVAQVKAVVTYPVGTTAHVAVSAASTLSTVRDLRAIEFAETLAFGFLSTTEKWLSANASVSAAASTDSRFVYGLGALVFARAPLALRRLEIQRPVAAQTHATATLSPATLRTDYKGLAGSLNGSVVAAGAFGALGKPLAASALAAANATPLLGVVQSVASGVQAVASVSVNLVLNLREVAASARASARASVVLSAQKVAQGAATAAAVVTGELSVTHLGVAATARAITQADLILDKPVGASGTAKAAAVDAGLGQARLAASKTAAATASVSTVAARPLATTGAAAAVVVDAALGQVRLSASATARATITPVGLSLNKGFSASRVAQANQVAAGLSIDQPLIAVVRAEVTAAADLRLDLKELRRTVAAAGTAQASLGDLNKTLSAQRAAAAVVADAGLSQVRLSAITTARAAVSAAGLESSKPLEVQDTAKATVTDAGLMQARLSTAATTASSALATARMRWACQAQVLVRATPSAASSVIRPAAAQVGTSAASNPSLALVKRLGAPVSAGAAQSTAWLLLGNEMLALVDAGASAGGDIQIDKPLSGEATTAVVPDVDLRLDKFLEGQGAAVALPLVKLRSAYPGVYVDQFTVYGPDVYVDDVTADLSVDSIYADVELIFVDYRKAA